MPPSVSERSGGRAPADLAEASADLRPEVERLVIELCRSSSASHDRRGLRRTAELLAGELGALGLEARLDEDLVLEAVSGERPELLVVGHFDTVLAAREPRRDGDRLLATGAVDMKGGIAAFLGALKTLHRLGEPPPAFRLALVPDEEVGGPACVDVVRRHGAGAREMWVLEPGQGVENGETVVLGRWGLAIWSLEALGVAAHAGVDFAAGRSALAAAARWIDRAQDLAVVHDGTTVNAASFQSAAGGEEPPLNVVPARATVRGELRYVDDRAGDELLASLVGLTEEVIRETGVELDFSVKDRVRAHAAGEPTAWLPRLEELAAASGLRLEVERSRRGISFANFLPQDAHPLVLDGLGPVGGGMHTESEWLSLDSLHRRTHWLARLLLEGGFTAASRARCVE